MKSWNLRKNLEPHNYTMANPMNVKCVEAKQPTSLYKNGEIDYSISPFLFDQY